MALSDSVSLNIILEEVENDSEVVNDGDEESVTLFVAPNDSDVEVDKLTLWDGDSDKDEELPRLFELLSVPDTLKLTVEVLDADENSELETDSVKLLVGVPDFEVVLDLLTLSEPVCDAVKESLRLSVVLKDSDPL